MYTEKYRNLIHITHSILVSIQELASNLLNKEVKLVTKENKYLCVVDGIIMLIVEEGLVYTYFDKLGLKVPERIALGHLAKSLQFTISESNKDLENQK
ncbi:hypothetical protein RNIID_0880 [Staphylococcus phage phiRNIID]|nr:hypothetical protein RNIID_0880 [Staphylococcus phage phiRNIID]